MLTEQVVAIERFTVVGAMEWFKGRGVSGADRSLVRSIMHNLWTQIKQDYRGW